jgi:tetratricopeptide (TPR) repeat protein
MLRQSLLLANCLLFTPFAMAIDLANLWDFHNPQASEQRFRAELAKSSGDDALILTTQIARTYGLRKDFTRARSVLAEIEPQMKSASPQARARFALEYGRTLSSATHPPQTQTDSSKTLARAWFDAALTIAREDRLDSLAIDAIHMLAFVDTAPADQLKWAQAALVVVETSDQADVKNWEASIRNNLGYALHQLGRYEEALVEFKLALAKRESGANAQATRIAHWMIAWTLRSLKRIEEALAIQLRLEREGDLAKQPDPYVFEELEILYRDRGDDARAKEYASRRAALPK